MGISRVNVLEGYAAHIESNNNIDGLTNLTWTMGLTGFHGGEAVLVATTTCVVEGQATLLRFREMPSGMLLAAITGLLRQ